MKCQTITFDGALLERGFWLYVWHVQAQGRALVYVGRTGDSSSANAASPFARVSQHLDTRPKAPANMLLRHLRKAGVDHHRAVFRLVAVGPIFAEVKDFEKHRRRRDVVAAMEAALWKELRDRGYEVVGQAASRKPLDRALFAQVLATLASQLDALPPAVGLAKAA